MAKKLKDNVARNMATNASIVNKTAFTPIETMFSKDLETYDWTSGMWKYKTFELTNLVVGQKYTFSFSGGANWTNVIFYGAGNTILLQSNGVGRTIELVVPVNTVKTRYDVYFVDNNQPSNPTTITINDIIVYCNMRVKDGVKINPANIDYNSITWHKISAENNVTYGGLVAGYIAKIDGSLGNAASHRSTDYLPVEVGRVYKFPSYNIFSQWGAIYDLSKTFVTSNENDLSRFNIDVINSCVYYTPVTGDTFIRLTATNNSFSTANFYFKEKLNIVDKVIQLTPLIKKKYGHCVNKPYVFNAKTALFFGDSITKGNVNGTTITPNGYPKLFSDKVGLTFTNKGNSGSAFSVVNGGVERIITTVTATTLNTDYIFIAAGVNDWQLGVPLSDFETAISELCTYIKTTANYTGQVIFITPINYSSWHNKEITDLDDYRNIITEYAILNGFSVVDGSKFNFPSKTGAYATACFGDGLHPTEAVGYPIYAKELQTVLC